MRSIPFITKLFVALLVITPLAAFVPCGEVRGFARKLIIMWPVDSIEPVAALSDNGRHVEVTIGGPAVMVQGNTSIDATVLVYQESTGALALADWKSPRVPGNEEVEETRQFSVKLHAIGNESFEGGAATAAYFAEERAGGKLVRSWSHVEDVVLLTNP